MKSRFTPNKKIGSLGARPQGLEHHRDNLPICCSFRLRHRLSVDVHRRLDRGVTHEFLLDLHRCPGLVEARTVCVGKRRSAEFAELPCCRGA
jgi:hypothetical protein